jgi:hypothetical protein
MHDQLKSLLIRYRHNIEIKDLYENDVVILFNEERKDFLDKMKKFSRSNYCKLDEPIITKYEFSKEFTDKWAELQALTGMKAKPTAYVDKVTHQFDVITFIEYGIDRGYDWVVFTRKEWEAVAPKKKKKFIKPKER